VLIYRDPNEKQTPFFKNKFKNKNREKTIFTINEKLWPSSFLALNKVQNYVSRYFVLILY